jgi:hypothetical protein
VKSMPRVICLEPGCNQLVELPVRDEALADTSQNEYGTQRVVELRCPKGHLHDYLVGP